MWWLTSRPRAAPTCPQRPVVCGVPPANPLSPLPVPPRRVALTLPPVFPSCPFGCGVLPADPPQTPMPQQPAPTCSQCVHVPTCSPEPTYASQPAPTCPQRPVVCCVRPADLAGVGGQGRGGGDGGGRQVGAEGDVGGPAQVAHGVAALGSRRGGTGEAAGKVANSSRTPGFWRYAGAKRNMVEVQIEQAVGYAPCNCC